MGADTNAAVGCLNHGHVTPEVSTPCERSATSPAADIRAGEDQLFQPASTVQEAGHRIAPSPVAKRENRKGRVSLADLFRQANRPSLLHKPHQANDAGWEAIERVRETDGELGLNHFKLIRRVGCGDIGSVYLAELQGTKFRFAMKVMDLGSLASRRKQLRAETERDILSSLDHPFLPTLYAHFDTPQFLCLVMEFCPGGDLHSLRQEQDRRFFSVKAARFYAAEVLLAVEYLHMMGVVYRDLKPENVLVRGDGHVMLSDFDLSLKCAVSPTVLAGNRSHGRARGISNAKSVDKESSSANVDGAHGCYNHGSCLPRNRRVGLNLFTCADIASGAFDPKLGGAKWRPNLSKAVSKPCAIDQVAPLPELVAEPSGVRSMSFVGTHEYLAPEIISGEGHGSPVDWWTFGIFLFELLYGKTPFKGEENEITLVNVLAQPLEFPAKGDAYYRELEAPVQDLIKALLVKDPQKRLGFNRGATEVKQHPFFEGINWALIRCTLPPQIPKSPNRTLHPPSKSAKPSPSSPGKDTQHTKNYDMIGESTDRSTMHFEYF